MQHTPLMFPVNISRNRGFTLVEVLVAISLLLLVLVGPLTFLTRASQSTEIANQQVVAVYLAQEGAELVQLARDNRLLEWFAAGNPSGGAGSTPWQQFKDDVSACISTNGCAIQLSSGASDPNREVGLTVIACGTAGSNCLMYLSNSAGRVVYNYGTGEPTLYTRRIILEDRGDEVAVTSEVTWRTGTLIQTQRAVVETSVINIYDTN